jgi:biopolymer transport protein ExbB
MILLLQISLFSLLSQGGWAMIPLALLSFSLFSLILLVWLQTSPAAFGLRPNRLYTTGILQDLLPRLQENGASDRSVRVEDALASVESATLRWIQYLNVIATIAPMVGLLGTVSGMIGAFQTIASGGMGKPELLAGDIGEALITTATGLVIGIPAMIFFFILRNRLEARLEALESALQEPGEASASDATTAS